MFKGSVFKALNKNHFHSGSKIPFNMLQEQCLDKWMEFPFKKGQYSRSSLEVSRPAK